MGIFRHISSQFLILVQWISPSMCLCFVPQHQPYYLWLFLNFPTLHSPKADTNQTDFLTFFFYSSWSPSFLQTTFCSLIFSPYAYFPSPPANYFFFILAYFSHSLLFLHQTFLIFYFRFFLLTRFTCCLFPKFKSLLKRTFCVFLPNPMYIIDQDYLFSFLGYIALEDIELGWCFYVFVVFSFFI